MEEKAYKENRDSIKDQKQLKIYCKQTNIACGKITEKNFKNKREYFLEKNQKQLKKDIKDKLGKIKIDLGVVKYYENRDREAFVNITDEKTYIIYDDTLYDFENDILYDDIVSTIIIMDKILEYNNFHIVLNRATDKKTKLINIGSLNKISELLKYKDIMKNQYKTLENYFKNTKFPNQLNNNIIDNFVHYLSSFNLEILLRSGSNKFINPISGNTYDSERGIYTTLKTNKCQVANFGWADEPALVFSKQLANDFGYIFNFSYQYGIVTNDTLIKGQKFKIKGKDYSAVEKGTLLLCKKENRPHEVVFFTDHIKIKDYLEAIVFYDKEQYDLFKNMKGIRFKNKMILMQ